MSTTARPAEPSTPPAGIALPAPRTDDPTGPGDPSGLTVDIRPVPLPDGAAFVYARDRGVLFVNASLPLEDVDAALAAYTEWAALAATA